MASLELKQDGASLREAIRKLAKGRTCLLPGPIFKRLTTETGMNSIRLKDAMYFLRENGELKSAQWDRDSGMPAAKLYLNLPPLPVEPYVTEWCSLVSASSFPEDAQAALARPAVAEKFRDMSLEERRRLLEALQHLVANQESIPKGAALYDVSAKYLMGSSKLLSTLGDKLLTAVGFDVSRFSKGPRYIAVAGPRNPKAVIIVENPHAFETAAMAGTDCAFACSYGFGLAIDRDARHGELLVENLTNRRDQIIRLVRAGDPPEIPELLGHPNLFFWGDLDPAGLMIYSQLKASFPQIRLSALYEPMVDALRSGIGHVYCKSVGKEGQRFQAAKFKEIGALLRECSGYGIDQEYISLNVVKEFADKNYSY